jgi:hypothetical protein
MIPLVMAALGWAMAGRAHAQVDDHRRFNRALGFGGGLVRVEEQGLTHFTGSFRFNWWDEDQEEDNVGRVLSSRQNRMKGFLEAEVGYWKDTELTPVDRDLSSGINAIGVLPTRSVDFFFGGGMAAHFLRASGVQSEEDPFEDDTRFGANIQFGVDLNFTDPVSFFALGRYDLLQGEVVDFQSKILLGARWRF